MTQHITINYDVDVTKIGKEMQYIIIIIIIIIT
jgi:hypothetical protein